MRRLAASLAAFLVLASPVSAKEVTGSLVLDQANPSFGDFISFSVTELPEIPKNGLSAVFLRLECSQDGEVVGAGYDRVDRDPLDGHLFGLYSPSWTGGAADCAATLITLTRQLREVEHAAIAFHVNAV